MIRNVFFGMDGEMMFSSDLPDCCQRQAHDDGPMLICPTCGAIYMQGEITSKDEAVEHGWLPEDKT